MPWKLSATPFIQVSTSRFWVLRGLSPQNKNGCLKIWYPNIPSCTTKFTACFAGFGCLSLWNILSESRTMMGKAAFPKMKFTSSTVRPLLIEIRSLHWLSHKSWRFLFGELPSKLGFLHTKTASPGYRRKFRSLTSDNMDSWKSRVE